MEAKEDISPSLDHLAAKNGIGNESCMLIEDNITVIELNDTIENNSKNLEDGELETDESDAKLNESLNGNSQLQLSEFQVIDEIGDVESAGDQEKEDFCNTSGNGNESAVSKYY